MLQAVTQRFHKLINNDNDRDLLIDFCAENNLRINNTYLGPDIRYKYTLIRYQRQESMIGNKQPDKAMQKLGVRALKSADIGSDHALAISFIEKISNNTIEKLKMSSMKNPST